MISNTGGFLKVKQPESESKAVSMLYDELQPDNEQEPEEDTDLNIEVIEEAEKLNEDDGKVFAPKYGYYQVQKKPAPSVQQNEKNGFGKKLLTTVVLAVVFGLVAGVVMNAVTRSGAPAAAKENTTTVSAPPKEVAAVETISHEKEEEVERASDTEASAVPALTGKGAVADAAAACMPSVVAITSVSIQEIPSFFGYGSQTYQSESSGSGIIVGENEDELLIATNNHVVSSASTLSVLFIGDDGASSQYSEEENSLMSRITDDLNYEGAVNALVKGADPENDLAVIAVSKKDIPDEIMEKIKIAALGNSDDLVVGEQVVAIGNALGYGQSVTSGWISALDRSMTSGDVTVSHLIQTDAAINPGNSGGALLNMDGEVIGINSAKYAQNNVEGMGYAIPISKASPILNDLMTRKTRVKLDSSEAAYMGVSVADLSREASWMYGIPEGAFVAQAFEGGAAYNAGIQQGDIIVMMDDYEVKDREDLIDMLSYYRPGEQVQVVLYRKGMDGTYKKKSLSVTMGSRQ